MKATFKTLALAAAVSGALAAPQVMAYEAGDWIVRGGVTTVDPRESSSTVTLDGGAVAGGHVGADSATQVGITITNMYSDRVGFELLLATPFKHHVVGTGALAGIDLAEVEQLPPTLSVIYYLTDGQAFQPYVGAGINYTLFFSEESKVGGGADLDDSFGLALQVGADYKIDENWHVNASVRWIDIDTDATLNGTALGKIETSVDIDPMVYSLMVGYKF